MELSLEWPSMVIPLESLRPLSPEILDNEQIKKATDVDIVSRGELARKLLNHFDELQEKEPESFDWFSNEKSIDIPFFENLTSSSFPYKIDLKPSFQTYAPPTTTTTSINASDCQQQHHQHLSSLSPNLYDALPSALLYSPPPQRFQSPPPVVPQAQSTPLLVTASAPIYSNCDVKTECNPLAAAAGSASSASLDALNNEWLKIEALTPPDSPKDEEILKMLEEIEPEALERLVMARTDELGSSTQLTFEEEMSCALRGTYSDDCVNSSGCSRSGSVSPYTTSDGGLDDPEWTPPSRIHQHSSTRGNNNNNNNNNNNSANNKYAGDAISSGSAAARRRASKPYTKPAVEERRQRKKDQNKNAATRYRIKKKAEVEVVKHEEQLQTERNDELKKQLKDICREVRYLKSLMREAYRKKGLIK